jgi:hypothetical protein
VLGLVPEARLLIIGEGSLRAKLQEQAELLDVWLDEPEAAVSPPGWPNIIYVEQETNSRDRFDIDLSHFISEPDQDELKWMLGLYVESPPDTREDVIKILNDIISQRVHAESDGHGSPDQSDAEQGQPPVEDEHRHDYPDQAEERAQKLREALREKLVEGIDVVGDPAHQIPHGTPIVVPQGEAQKPLEDAFPHGGEDALPDRADLADLAALGQRARAVDPKENRHRSEQPGGISPQNVAVYSAPDQPRSDGLGERADRDEHEGERQRSAVGSQLVQQLPGRRALVLGALLGGAGY